MSILSKIVLASALALSVAAPALAETAQPGSIETQTLAERNVYLYMDGKMIRMQVGDTTHAMIMKEFKPLKNGTMVYVSNGKVYIGENKKLTDGKMLHTAIYGRDICVSCN